MKKIIKLLFIFILIFLFLSLSSCFKRETFIFKEGKYEYSGEEFEFYDGISISYISINFELVDEEDTTNQNIILNRKNNKSYYMDFYIENGEGEGFHCDFIDLEKVGDMVDNYFVDVDMSSFFENQNSVILTVDIELSGSNDSKNDFKIEATRIYIYIYDFKIDDSYINEYYIPYALLLKYVEEEEYDEKD